MSVNTTTPAKLGRIRYVRVDTKALRMAISFSGLTHEQIARKAKLSQSSVGMLASGNRTTCKADTAAAIAKALKQKPADLFELRATRNR